MPEKDDRKRMDARRNRRAFLQKSAMLGAGTVVVGSAACAGPANTETRQRAIRTVYPNQDDSEVRWGFLVDLNRCTGCNSCAVACKTEYDVRLGRFRSGVISHETGTYPTTQRHFVPWLCNHCKNPPCMEDCPTDPLRGSVTFPSGDKAAFDAKATYQRADGLVLIDQERCIGCGACVGRCPYQARYLDPVKRKADKCSLCVHRLEEGVVPACANTCPAEARIVGNLNDPDSEINQRLGAAGANVSTILESAGTEPVVFYIGLNDEAYANGEEPRKEAGLQTQL